MSDSVALLLSGTRFQVEYAIFGDEDFAHFRANEIIIEQTIEYPPELVKSALIKDHIVGRIEDLQQVADGLFNVIISYTIEETGFNLPQFLNVVYGNISMKTGVRVEKIHFPPELLKHFKGPRFGKEGMRKLVKVFTRPLTCSAIKPMGLPLSELVQMASDYAYGGLDMIKDDHGLNDLPFSHFKERVARCAEAILEANAKTGFNTLYFPCIVTPFERLLDYAHYAKEVGASGFLAVPGLTGFDSMRMLADQDDLNLPILYHPAFQGSYYIGEQIGFSKYSFFGQIARLAGADASIFPNFGGRFSFSRTECEEIVSGCNADMGNIKPIFPAAAGGLTFQVLPEMQEVYGHDVLFIMGGGLHRESADLVANCRKLREMLENN